MCASFLHPTYFASQSNDCTAARFQFAAHYRASTAALLLVTSANAHRVFLRNRVLWASFAGSSSYLTRAHRERRREIYFTRSRRSIDDSVDPTKPATKDASFRKLLADTLAFICGLWQVTRENTLSLPLFVFELSEPYGSHREKERDAADGALAYSNLLRTRSSNDGRRRGRSPRPPEARLLPKNESCHRPRQYFILLSFP